MSNIKVLRKEDYNTSEWSGGTTTEVYIYPEGSIYKEMDFNFRISSATVDLDESTFTSLPGIHRFITPLDGDLKLTHDGESFTNLEAFEVYEFDGGINTTSYGRVRDFNLMLGKGTEGKLYNLEIDGDKDLSLDENKLYLIFNYKGNLKVNENLLGDMDSIVIRQSDKVSLKSDGKLKLLVAEVEI